MRHFFTVLIGGVILCAMPHNATANCTPLGLTDMNQGLGANYENVYDDTKNCAITPASNTIYYIYDGGTGSSTEKDTGWLLIGCGTCKNNKRSVLKRITLPCGYYDIYACDEDCGTSCNNCESDLAATDYSEGYMRKLSRQCQNCICTATSAYYTCAKGYYGNSYTTTDFYAAPTGCTRCPKLDTANATTSTYGSSSNTSCYIPSGIDITDDIGTYSFTNSCYYKN